MNPALHVTYCTPTGNSSSLAWLILPMSCASGQAALEHRSNKTKCLVARRKQGEGTIYLESGAGVAEDDRQHGQEARTALLMMRQLHVCVKDRESIW